MCQCEDRPCCGCDQEMSNRYENDPSDLIDAWRERMEYEDEDEDEDEENEDAQDFILHEDQDYLTD